MTTEIQAKIDLQTAFADICQLVFKGDAMTAFEKYYADTVVMQENDEPPTIGKEANRIREQAFFEKVLEIRQAKVENVAFGDNVIFSEWWLDYTHADWGKRTHHQVSVQQWQDGKVVHERFYYGA